MDRTARMQETGPGVYRLQMVDGGQLAKHELDRLEKQFREHSMKDHGTTMAEHFEAEFPGLAEHSPDVITAITDFAERGLRGELDFHKYGYSEAQIAQMQELWMAPHWRGVRREA